MYPNQTEGWSIHDRNRRHACLPRWKSVTVGAVADPTGGDAEKQLGYSDSHNDLPLLRRVENPVAVLPDPILRAYAKQHGWKIIENQVFNKNLA